MLNHFAKEMKIMKKILLALMALAFIATPAVAGNQPEFDAVACDASNYFSDFVRTAVCNNGTVVHPTLGLIKINEYSAFPNESFFTTAGQPYLDPCFNNLRPGCQYTSALTDPWNEAIYRWVIVLQKKPESDINLNIRDCVLKHNLFNVWTECEQTGRYRAPWGELFFVPTANPSVTVTVAPGPFATPGFTAAFTLDARTMPGLALAALDDAVYTSKCLWEETLVIKLPTTGGVNVGGQSEYNLKQGDVITVLVTIPGNNTVDLFYGQDNVSLEYIGIVGTEYVSSTFCGLCAGCGAI